MRRSMLLVVLAVAAFPIAAAGQTTFRVDSTAIDASDSELAALRVEYAAAANAGDARRLSALYAPDARAVWTEGLLLRGAVEIQRYSHEVFSSTPAAAMVTLTPHHFEMKGSMASETGAFSEMPSAAGQPGATGVYVTIYTRGTDGAWRIAMEVRTRGRDKQAVRW